MSQIRYLTKEGYEQLTHELDDLKSRGRKEAADAIQKAREMGDLSENAEYDAAKDAQGLLEMRIAKLENALANSRILDTSEMEDDKVYILSTVKVKNLKTKKEASYTLVDEREANLKEGKISASSPVGQSLMGHHKGDIVEVEVPAGLLQFKILDISLSL